MNTVAVFKFVYQKAIGGGHLPLALVLLITLLLALAVMVLLIFGYQVATRKVWGILSVTEFESISNGQDTHGQNNRCLRHTRLRYLQEKYSIDQISLTAQK
ncbi:hypothetical protein IJI76_00635 [Candidatus Saccharibacteria bacterium]|nr:hypothetical protein [Candidatus Saccharibacteria bacterium]